MRYCEKCGMPVIKEGFVIDGGLAYYCSEECLYQVYTREEWEELYSDDGENYWTEWEVIDLVTHGRLIEFKIDDVLKVVAGSKWGSIEEFIINYNMDDVLKLEDIIKRMKQGK